MTLRPSAALTTATAAGPLTAHASSSGPPAFTLDVSVQSSRFHEAVATTIYVKGINIAVGGGADASKRELLTDADLSLATGTRYALIGRNGSGKSILLRVLASGALFDPDDQLSLRVQLVSQSWAPPPHPGWTVLDEVGAPPFGHDLSDALDAGRRADRRSDLRSGRRGKEARVESLALAAAGEGDGDSGDCGGDDYGDYHDPPSTTDVAAAFMTLGIPIGMLEQRWETLSGGWRMRVVLAKALIYQPRVLLLDEPTNHLDLLGITHLVRLLKDDTHFPDTTIVFVSHDLFFVNELAQSVIQLQDLKLVTAKGNWDTLQRERSDRKTWTDRMAAEQEREQARLMGSLATSMRRAAERGDDKGQRQLASRRDKALERGSGLMRNSHGHRFKRNDAENAGYHLTLLNEVETVREERPVRFRLEEPAWPRAVAGPGSPLLALDGLAFRYTGGGKPAGAAFSLELKDLSLAAGERLVLLGPNGHGKSTLLRLLVGELRPHKGTVKVALPSSMVGYFEQHAVSRLGAETRSALRYVMDVHGEGPGGDGGGPGGPGRRLDGGGLDEEAARKALGGFGLGPCGDTPVGQLSGGQRVALEFVVLSLRRPGLLVLDEPSAHLDLQASEGLAAALALYPGTVVMVSHDVGFLHLCNPTRALLCERGRFRPVEADRWRREALALR